MTRSLQIRHWSGCRAHVDLGGGGRGRLKRTARGLRHGWEESGGTENGKRWKNAGESQKLEPTGLKSGLEGCVQVGGAEVWFEIKEGGRVDDSQVSGAASEIGNLKERQLCRWGVRVQEVTGSVSSVLSLRHL